MATVKKSAVKKTVKKPVTKSVAKKTAGKAVAKKSASKSASKAVLKAEAKPVAVKKEIKRVPPRIIRKPPVIVKPAQTPLPEIDTEKAVAFAMSIAKKKKQDAAASDRFRSEQEIRLTRRPTTRTQGESTVHFPDKDLKDFRKRLIDARVKALSGVDAMKATGFNESEDHEADGGDGTNQTLRLQALGHMGAINRTIQQIEEALHRIDDGTYGVCTICGQLIRKPRLINQPFVQTCMECQSEIERDGRA